MQKTKTYPNRKLFFISTSAGCASGADTRRFTSATLASFRPKGAGLEFNGRPVVFEKALEALDMNRNADAMRLRRGRLSRREVDDIGATSRDPCLDSDTKNSERLSTTGEPTNCSFPAGLLPQLTSKK